MYILYDASMLFFSLDPLCADWQNRSSSGIPFLMFVKYDIMISSSFYHSEQMILISFIVNANTSGRRNTNHQEHVLFGVYELDHLQSNLLGFCLKPHTQLYDGSWSRSSFYFLDRDVLPNYLPKTSFTFQGLLEIEF